MTLTSNNIVLSLSLSLLYAITNIADTNIAQAGSQFLTKPLKHWWKLAGFDSLGMGKANYEDFLIGYFDHVLKKAPLFGVGILHSVTSYLLTFSLLTLAPGDLLVNLQTYARWFWNACITSRYSFMCPIYLLPAPYLVIPLGLVTEHAHFRLQPHHGNCHLAVCESPGHALYPHTGCTQNPGQV